MTGDAPPRGNGSPGSAPSPPALLLDLDGVIYSGDDLLQGAAEAVRWVQEHGDPYLFVTNTSSVPRAAIVKKLGRLGISVREEAILSPPAAAARWIGLNVEGPVALFVSESTKAEFASCPVLAEDEQSGASAVIIGDLGEGWTFGALNQAFRLLIGPPEPPLVALGMTRFWRTPSGLTMDVGPFVTALEYAAGKKALVLGKPAQEFFDDALGRLGASAASTWMFGDDIQGDVAGAQAAGLKGVLVRTGKFREGDLEQGIEPDGILDSIADLPDWWSSTTAIKGTN